MTEDQPALPAAPRQISGATKIEVACAVKCGATDKVPAYEDRTEKDPAKRLKPVAAYPYVCLACWRLGWRSDGPIDGSGRYRIYHVITQKEMPT